MEKKSVLIVEDETIAALDIKSTLTNLGYDVAGIASTGEQAVAIVNTKVPDLILMDIHLAGKLSGIEAAEKILLTHNVPIIYLTAYSESELVERAKKTRPYGYIIKPFAERVLQTEIEIALYRFGLDREYQREHARLEGGAREGSKELEQANAALRESEQKFHEFVDLLPEVVFECDLTGNLTYVNDNSLRFFGYSREELKRGLNLLDHIIPEDRQRVVTGLGRIAGGATTTGTEFTGMKRDGTRFPLLVYSTRVLRDNCCTAIRGILIDITERKNTEHAMQQALQKLSLLNTITRHDILNKLTALDTYLTLAADEETNPKIVSYIHQCNRVVATISKHVEFMRDYQEIGVRSPIWQDPVVTIRQESVSCDTLGLTFQIPEPGWEIFCDPLFERVIYTLIDNALRHGEYVKTITFTLQESGKELHLVYEDDGAGISEEFKNNLFEKGSGRHTGLGLFLSREILSITGISIRETSASGQGARFEIIVPEGAYRRSR